mgnify:CR=1 FL=1
MKKILQKLGLAHSPAEPMAKLLRDPDSIYFKPEIRKVYPDRLLDFNDNFKHIHKETQRTFVDGLTRNLLVLVAVLVLASCASTASFNSARVESVEGYKESCMYLLSYKDGKKTKYVYMQENCNQFYVNDSIFFTEQIVLK